MKLIIKGRHMVVTDAIHAYAEEKIGRISKILDRDHMTTEVELFVEKNPSIERRKVAEVTVWTKGPIIRAKEASTDMYAAIDLVSEKLERQFRKYKGKVQDRYSAKAPKPPMKSEPDGEEARPAIVKSKTLTLKPMSPEEAMLQLELLGHDFFVFASAETDVVNILYRRRDGDYGLIEPRIG